MKRLYSVAILICILLCFTACDECTCECEYCCDTTVGTMAEELQSEEQEAASQPVSAYIDTVWYASEWIKQYNQGQTAKISIGDGVIAYSDGENTSGTYYTATTDGTYTYLETSSEILILFNESMLGIFDVAEDQSEEISVKQNPFGYEYVNYIGTTPSGTKYVAQTASIYYKSGSYQYGAPDGLSSDTASYLEKKDPSTIVFYPEVSVLQYFDEENGGGVIYIFEDGSACVMEMVSPCGLGMYDSDVAYTPYGFVITDVH